MVKKEYVVIALIMVCLMSMPFVLSVAPEENIIASVSNPRMVLYKTIVNGEPVEFANSVFVNNENDFKVSITLDPQGVWKDHVTLREKTVVLDAGERKEIFYDIKITEPGEYPGDIIVMFKKEGYPNTLSISQRVVVHVDEEGNSDIIEDDAKNSGIKILSVSVIVFVLILLLLLSIFSRKKVVKKSGEGKSKK